MKIEKINNNGYTIDPNKLFARYVDSCKINDIDQVSELDFMKKMVFGVSCTLSACISAKGVGIIKFAMTTDKEGIWCLMIPCKTLLSIIFGTENGIDETINNLSSKLEEIDDEQYTVSSVDKFF